MLSTQTLLVGLAVGLGFGALAEVAKKSLRPENSTGELGPRGEVGSLEGWALQPPAHLCCAREAYCDAHTSSLSMGTP